jgi:hypothetical protein
MYDKDDYLGRWVQFACAIPLLLIGGGLLYLAYLNPYRYNWRLGGGGCCCLMLSGRCLWYAITGRNNINKDLYP